jgi:hypothetical protein
MAKEREKEARLALVLRERSASAAVINFQVSKRDQEERKRETFILALVKQSSDGAFEYMSAREVK